MAIVDRVKAILLSPKTEWPVIEAETTDIASVYKNYLIYLAAIPALAQFLGLSIFGPFGFFGGLTRAVVTYVLSLVMLYVLALIVNALAPTFNGQKSQTNAFKVIAYAYTAYFVSSILWLVPLLAVLILLGGIYSIYLLYLGLPVLMKCPPEKAMAYTAVTIICAIVASFLVFTVVGFFGLGMRPMMVGQTPVLPATTARLQEKMDVASKQLDAASKQMEAAANSKDPAAMGKALSDVMAAASSVTGGREPIAPDSLKAVLPAVVAGMDRSSFEAQGGAALGIKGSSAKATYGTGDKTFRLEITDLGGLAGLASLAGWANVTGEKENDQEVEKTYKSGKRMIKEHTSKSSPNAEYTVILENGVVIEGRGQGMDLAAVKKAVEGLDLGALEAAKAKG